MALRKPRRQAPATSITITSMMDMMTIILVFLLKNFATTDITITPSDALQLPVSSAQNLPKLSVNLVVSRDQILLDGVPVLKLGSRPDTLEPDGTLEIVPAEEMRGRVITRLHDRLVEKATVAKALGERSGNEDHAFKGEILLQVDRDLPFSVLREVMYTAGQAQFSEFRFVVYKME